ncbi:hypothetical protein [Domibacillus tundrae]|uniref:hypothetical protein n=1 Tax=Domibacillus tundrae TaxID=1587527 RepID=UPI0033948E20
MTNTSSGVNGMENLVVVYGDIKLEVPANIDLNALKVAMAENFPELKSAEVTQEGNTVKFAPKAGTKGNYLMKTC